jgi:hypothetical protein
VRICSSIKHSRGKAKFDRHLLMITILDMMLTGRCSWRLDTDLLLETFEYL